MRLPFRRSAPAPSTRRRPPPRRPVPVRPCRRSGGWRGAGSRTDMLGTAGPLVTKLAAPGRRGEPERRQHPRSWARSAMAIADGATLFPTG